jgi:hypothetical protein
VSARAEELQRGGSTAASSSPAFGGWRRFVLSSGSGEKAKKRGEKLSVVLVVRLRARIRGPGRCVGLATAASRWRPPGLVGVAWRGVEAPARGGSGSRGQWGDAWGGGEAGVGQRPAQSGGRRCRHACRGRGKRAIL